MFKKSLKKGFFLLKKDFLYQMNNSLFLKNKL